MVKGGEEMTITIPEFLLGIIVTLLVEVVLIVIYGITHKKD